jgi:hypothetical protein
MPRHAMTAAIERRPVVQRIGFSMAQFLPHGPAFHRLQTVSTRIAALFLPFDSRTRTAKLFVVSVVRRGLSTPTGN